MKFLYVIVSLLSLAGPVAAQSVEETVAFIVNGLSEGRNIKSEARTLTVSQTAKNPLTYVIKYDPPSEGMTGATIRQVAQCEFDFDFTGDPHVKHAHYDFNSFVGASVSKFGTVLLSFSGSCPIKYDGSACYAEDTVPFDFRTTPERLQTAISYLKANYCKGRAF